VEEMMAAPRKDNVKEKIIEATEELLSQKGISDISLAEIAKTAGISKGTLYYHYKTKDDILFDIMDNYLEEQWNNLIDWTEDENKDTSLHRLVKYVVERNIATAQMRIHLFYGAILGNEEIRLRLVKRYSEFEELIAKKISERTSTMSAEFLTWLILTTSDGLYIQKLLANPGIDVQNFIETGTKLIEKMENGKPLL